MKAWLVFLLFFIGTVVFGIATYLTPQGSGRLPWFGMTLFGAAFTLGSFPGN